MIQIARPSHVVALIHAEDNARSRRCLCHNGNDNTYIKNKLNVDQWVCITYKICKQKWTYFANSTSCRREIMFWFCINAEQGLRTKTCVSQPTHVSDANTCIKIMTWASCTEAESFINNEVSCNQQLWRLWNGQITLSQQNNFIITCPDAAISNPADGAHSCTNGLLKPTD